MSKLKGKLLEVKNEESKLKGKLLESKFMNIATDLGKLLEVKNEAYGNAFVKITEILSILYQDGIKPEQYKDLGLVIRILDKLCRIAKDNDPLGESPFQDIAGYAILAQTNKKKS